MPAKVDAARRCADIVAALARTANVRLSLRETGVSHFWAYRRRDADPDFRVRWDTAVRRGKRALADAVRQRARLEAAARPEAAAALTIVGSVGKGTLRLERIKPTSFTDDRRATFLDALRATCNVKAAARAARVSPHALYTRYHADAAFRTTWDETLAEGRAHLEMAMIGAARALFEAPRGQRRPAVAPADITGMDARLALQLLRLHAPHDARGRPRRKWSGPADPDATRASILAKVAALRLARAGPSGAPGGNGDGTGGGADAG